jgi:S-adenosylmethionine decarboxylase
MQGLHITADLHDCRCDAFWLVDAERVGGQCVAAVQAAGLQPVARLFHAFAATGAEPSGFTATVLLAESHLCLHTWPELRAVTLDVYVCNFGADHSAKAEALMDTLVALFQPAQVERHRLMRGQGAGQPAAAALA